MRSTSQIRCQGHPTLNSTNKTSQSISLRGWWTSLYSEAVPSSRHLRSCISEAQGTAETWRRCSLISPLQSCLPRLETVNTSRIISLATEVLHHQSTQVADQLLICLWSTRNSPRTCLKMRSQIVSSPLARDRAHSQSGLRKWANFRWNSKAISQSAIITKSCIRAISPKSKNSPISTPTTPSRLPTISVLANTQAGSGRIPSTSSKSCRRSTPNMTNSWMTSSAIKRLKEN